MNMDNNKSRRYRTFYSYNYPRKSLINDLLEAGFIYQGNEDEVFCPQCYKCFNNWQMGQSPFEVHKQASPDCPYVQYYSQQNSDEVHMDTNKTYNKMTQNFSQLDLHTNKHQEQTFSPESGSVSMYGGPVCQPSDDDQSSDYRPSLLQNVSMYQDKWQERVSHEPMSGFSSQSSTSSLKKKPLLLEDTFVQPKLPNSISNINANPHYDSNNSFSQRGGANNIVGMDHNSIEHRLSLNSFITSTPHDNFQTTRNNIPQSDAGNFTSQLSNNIMSPNQTQLPSPYQSHQNALTQHRTMLPHSFPLNQNTSSQHQIILPNSYQLPNQSTTSVSQHQAQLPNLHQVTQNTVNHHHTTTTSGQFPSSSRVNVTSNEAAMRLVNNTSEGQAQWLNPRAPVLNQFAQVDYTIKNNRIQSFQGRWPEGHFLTPEELAEAGLYYTGPNDRTQCAWCRGGLLNWEPTDTALGEHQRHFPECVFVRQKVASILSGRPVEGLPLIPDAVIDNDDEIVRTNIRPQPQPNNVIQRNYQPPVIPQPERSPTNMFSRNTIEEAKETVKGMGFGADIINLAVEKLLTNGVTEINSEVLLDTIFQIQEQPVDTLPANNLPSSSSNVHVSNDVDDTDTQQPKCKVCLDKGVEVLFLPCRHIVCCERCALRLERCPFCRLSIAGTVKAFIP